MSRFTPLVLACLNQNEKLVKANNSISLNNRNGCNILKSKK